jgi:hypothetical protein
MRESALELLPVFTRWQVRCSKCNTVFYADTEVHSTGKEILELEDVHCALHPTEDSVIELA